MRTDELTQVSENAEPPSSYGHNLCPLSNLQRPEAQDSGEGMCGFTQQGWLAKGTK